MGFRLVPVFKEDFIDRDDLLEEIYAELSDIGSNTGYALLGKRRVGKSYSKQDFLLTSDEIKNEVRRFFDVWIDSLKLTAREEEVVQIISHEHILSRGELIKAVLKKSKMARSTLFRIIENLIEKKVLLPIQTEKYEIDRKSGLYYKYFSPAK